MVGKINRDTGGRCDPEPFREPCPKNGLRSDCRSEKIYKELFGLQVILDQDGNVIMTEGLVLQDAKIWRNFIQKELMPKNNMTELYFEDSDIEGFAKKLEASEFEIEYLNELMEHSWGQKVIRFYDPDGNLIEVGTPVN